MKEPLEWRNARALSRSGALGTLGGRLEQAMPVADMPPPGHQTNAGRGHGIVVAAHDATDKEKRGADIVCDGTDDQVQINDALSLMADSAVGGGSVLLTAGDFQISAPIDVPQGGRLVGQHQWRSFIECVNCDGVHITNHAVLEKFGLWNSDTTHAGTVGVKSTETSHVYWTGGLITDLDIESFETLIDLASCRFDVQRNVLWGVGSPGTPIAVHLHTAAGLQWIVGNHIVYAPVHLEAGTQCRVKDNVFVPTGAALTTGTGTLAAFIADNDFGGGDVTIAGDGCRVRDNQNIDALAVSGDSNHVYGNQRASFSDTGVGNARNLDGSANDWNF